MTRAEKEINKLADILADFSERGYDLLVKLDPKSWVAEWKYPFLARVQKADRGFTFVNNDTAPNAVSAIVIRPEKDPLDGYGQHHDWEIIIDDAWLGNPTGIKCIPSKTHPDSPIGMYRIEYWTEEPPAGCKYIDDDPDHNVMVKRYMDIIPIKQPDDFPGLG